MVQFFESYWEKGSILCVIFKAKVFNSLRHIQSKRVQFFEANKKKVQFFASYSQKKGSILCVIFEDKKVQFFESNKKRFNSLHRNNSILWVKEKSVLWEISFFNKTFNSLSHACQKNQFFESYLKKKSSTNHI